VKGINKSWLLLLPLRIPFVGKLLALLVLLAGMGSLLVTIISRCRAGSATTH
jgi:hypothetical protein